MCGLIYYLTILYLNVLGKGPKIKKRESMVFDHTPPTRGGRSQDFTQSIPRPRLTQKIRDRSIPLETEGSRHNMFFS